MDSAIQGSWFTETEELPEGGPITTKTESANIELDVVSSEQRDDQTALHQFSAVSQHFIDSYNQLNQQVMNLREDLAKQTAEKERKALESESLAKKLQVVLSTLPNGVVVIDGHGVIQQANSVAIDMLGEPLEGCPWIEIIGRAFSPRSDDGHEISLMDGRRVKVDTQAIGSEPGQVVTLTDLTETRRQQESLSREQRLTTIGRMMASLAHQIRTPLSSALLYSGHITSPKIKKEKRQEFHRRMQQSLKQLEHNVSDMLLFASGGTAKAQRFSTEALIGNLKDNILNNMFAEHDIEMNTQIASDEPLFLYGNQRALCGAIGNLIENSIHACRDNKKCGRLTSISLDIEMDAPEHLFIMVTDNGCGMASENVNDIFEPFQTGKARGTGLGLAVVKTVVTNFKGTVEVNSRPGQGAQFIIRLPLISQVHEFLDTQSASEVVTKG